MGMKSAKCFAVFVEQLVLLQLCAYFGSIIMAMQGGGLGRRWIFAKGRSPFITWLPCLISSSEEPLQAFVGQSLSMAGSQYYWQSV